jgi:transglutaminase-like putative cysteine protease
VKRLPLYLLLCFVLSAGLARAGNKLPDWAAPLVDIDCSHYDTREVDAVCLLDQNRIDVDPSGKLVHTGRIAYRILTIAGTSRGTMVLAQASRSKIMQVRAWVRYPDGKTKGIKERDTLDTQYVDSAFFTDVRARIIPLPDVTRGSVVFFEWVMEREEEFMMEGWSFQNIIPVLSSQISFDLPPGVDLDWRAFNMPDDFQPQVKGRHYLFSRTDLPVLPHEEWAPAEIDLVERVELRFHCPAGGTPDIESWADVARWYYGITRQQWNTPQAIKSLSAEICKGAADSEEKILRLCNWVQSKIRYVAIEIGMGGYIPHDPVAVCRTKYGDCKDKSFLLMALLRAQGIEAWPVLCRSGSRGHILEDFAWPAAFDHCITAIGTPDSGIRYFDPTSETVGYPCLPANLEGSMGLVVREDSGNLVPMASGLQPELKVSVEAELCRSGILKARVREVYSLAALWEIRSVYRTLNDEERDRAWGEWISRRIPDATIQELNWINLHDPEKDLIIEYSLKAPGLVKRVGELTMLNPFFVQDVPKPSFSADQRFLPVSLESSAIRARQEVTLKLPPDLVLEESIEPCRLSYDFGTFTTSTTEGDGTLTLVKEYTVNHTTVPAARYSEVKAFFAAVNNVERTEILFVATTSEPSIGDSGSSVQ